EEVLIPAQEIADGREQPAVADHIREGHVGLETAIGIARVSRRPSLDDGGEIVAPPRMRHPERLEEPRLSKCIETLTAHALDDHPEEGVAGVAVGVFAARRKVERLLMNDEIER